MDKFKNKNTNFDISSASIKLYKHYFKLGKRLKLITWRNTMKKVLIVDDAAFMRMSIRNMISKHGFEIVGEAENGVVAIEKYKELQPDIVTMDITMPEMDGLEALREIKKVNPAAAVVMISALGQEARMKEAIIYGAKGFIVKPFKEEMLISALSKL